MSMTLTIHLQVHCTCTRLLERSVILHFSEIQIALDLLATLHRSLCLSHNDLRIASRGKFWSLFLFDCTLVWCVNLIIMIYLHPKLAHIGQIDHRFYSFKLVIALHILEVR